jgi:hypothetical protein
MLQGAEVSLLAATHVLTPCTQNAAKRALLSPPVTPVNLPILHFLLAADGE